MRVRRARALSLRLEGAESDSASGDGAATAARGPGAAARRIRAATLEKCVQQMCHVDFSRPALVTDVLMVHRHFTTSRHLMDLLKRRFHVSEGSFVRALFPSQAPPSERLRAVQRRVVDVLKSWVLLHWSDFEDEPALLDDLRAFLRLIKRGDSTIQGEAAQVEKAMDAKQEHSRRRQTVREEGLCPKSIMPSSAKKLALLDQFNQMSLAEKGDNVATFVDLLVDELNAEEVARQLTIAESVLYQQIRCGECLGQAWAKKGKEQNAANLLATIHRFNAVSGLCLATVLRAGDDSKRRAAAMRKWVAIGTHLLALHNYSGVMAIVAALEGSSIHRLKKTWAHLSSSDAKAYQELVDVMNPATNYKVSRWENKSGFVGVHARAVCAKGTRSCGPTPNSRLASCLPPRPPFQTYREHWRRIPASQPAIPYMGMYLTDLTFTDEGNPVSVFRSFSALAEREARGGDRCMLARSCFVARLRSCQRMRQDI